MATPFPPSDHRISLDDAVAIARAYRDDTPASPWPILGFSRQALDGILGQPGCAGVRIYPARHIEPDARPTVVLVGVDTSGADMMQGPLAQVPWECPPFCDEASPLLAG
jgi:hypothetical protein